MERYLNALDKIAEEHLNSIENEDIKQATRYVLFPGGKRLRPLFLLSALSDLGDDFHKGLYPAFGLELIHTYSLIHDDLPAMDNDDFRRGKPSLHKAFGEALAILVGDALLSDAFRYFTKSPITLENRLKLVNLASEISGSGGMVLGQVMDIQNEACNLAALEAMNLKKTGALFKLAFLGAGIIVNLDEEKLADLESLARWFGLGFQIKDDLEDFETEDKPTYPLLLGREESHNKLLEYKEKSLQIAGRILGNKEVYQLIERIL
ncbi:MAG TPA: polyprenyl synthetase family protein [Bacilli bacterium]